MASVDTGGGGGGKKGQPHRMDLRVDFTPMVDMNMLLITFFMFCTSLSKPQIMDIVMPTRDNVEVEDRNQVKASKSITVILGENNEVYYYEGEAKNVYDNWQLLTPASYGPDGLRAVLLDRNRENIMKMRELRIDRAKGRITEEDFKTQSGEIRNVKDGQVVVIKPTDGATYENLVDILDEMQICSIGKYAIVDMTDGDNFILQNYKEKGALSAQAANVRR